jgi:hypothetical protein
MSRLRSWAQINRDVADFKEQLSQSCPESLVLLVTDTPSQPLAAMSICEFGGIRLTLPLRLVLARDRPRVPRNGSRIDAHQCSLSRLQRLRFWPRSFLLQPSGAVHSACQTGSRQTATLRAARKRAPRVSVRSLIDETSGAGDTHRIAASAPFSPDENATFAADLAALLDNKRLHQLGILRNKGSIVGAQHSGGRSCDRIFYRPGARR